MVLEDGFKCVKLIDDKEDDQMMVFKNVSVGIHYFYMSEIAHQIQTNGLFAV